jgi:transcriptional regulator with GAF, ATPase, and Fis domain
MKNDPKLSKDANIDDIKNQIAILIEKAKEVIHKSPEDAQKMNLKAKEKAIAMNDKFGEAKATAGIAHYYFIKEDFKKSEILCEEALQLLQNNGYSDKIEKISNWFAFTNLKARRFDSALKFYTKSLAMAKELGIDSAIAGNLGNLGMVHTAKAEFKDAKESYLLSLEIQIRNNNIEGIARAYNGLALIEFKKESFDIALEYYFKACENSIQTENKIQTARIYNNIATIYNKMERFSNAIEYYEKSIEIKKLLKDQAGTAVSLNNIGTIYKKEGKYKKAISFYNEALELNKLIKNKYEISNNLNNIGSAYLETSEYEQAYIFFKKSEKIKKEINDTFGQVLINSNIGNVYCYQEKYDEAEKYILKGLNLVKKGEFKSTELVFYKSLFELYKITNDHAKCIDNLYKYINLNKELNQKIFSDKIAEMKTRFDTELKEKEAVFLREKNTELENKNKQIEKQKEELEQTLDHLRRSEINLSFASKELKRTLGTTIVGQSEQISKIINLISKVAETENTTVLVTGESGTGKELIARAIHDFSTRSKGNFCAVNVSSIPESLFESEFFGYKKNAFTGADRDKPGWFEIADKGTLFLDEIGTLSENLQIKLLRVLEEKKVVRIGSNKEIPIDIRIVSATNSKLFNMMEEGSFRSDLYHRLSTFVINLPPLRERISDVPLLLEHFVKIFGKQMNKKISKVERKAETLLLSYDFPGNIRELKNLIERAVIMCNSSTLKSEHFSIPKLNAENDCNEKIVPLEELEKKMLIKALKATGFHQAKAAKLLKIKPKAIERRMIKYGIKKLSS